MGWNSHHAGRVYIEQHAMLSRLVPGKTDGMMGFSEVRQSITRNVMQFCQPVAAMGWSFPLGSLD